MAITKRVTHIRRIFDDGVISSTDYESSEYAMNDDVFSAMGSQKRGMIFIDPNTGRKISDGQGTNFIDVEVADQLTIETGTGIAYQKVTRTYLWGDSWASDDPSWGEQKDTGAASILAEIARSRELDSNRVMDTKIIYFNISDDALGPGIPVPVIKSFGVTSAVGFQWQGTVHTLNNTIDTTSRKLTAKRLLQYIKIKDADKIVNFPLHGDTKVTETLKRTTCTGFQFQDTNFSPDNSEYYSHVNIEDLPDDAYIGPDGGDPPWILDPLQRIVNVGQAAGPLVFSAVWSADSVLHISNEGSDVPWPYYQTDPPQPPFGSTNAWISYKDEKISTDFPNGVTGEGIFDPEDKVWQQTVPVRKVDGPLSYMTPLSGSVNEKGYEKFSPTLTATWEKWAVPFHGEQTYIFPGVALSEGVPGATIHTGVFAQPDGINPDGSLNYPIIRGDPTIGVDPTKPISDTNPQRDPSPFNYEVGPTKSTGNVTMSVDDGDFDFKGPDGVIRTYRPIGINCPIVVTDDDHANGRNLNYPVGAGLVPQLFILCWPVVKGWSGE